MKIWKRLLALMLSVAVVCGACVPTAFATSSGTIGDKASNFWDTFFRIEWPLYGLIRNFLPGDKTEETATAQDWQDAYDQYTVNIQNNYGTTQIGSSGYFLPIEVDYYFNSPGGGSEILESVVGVNTSFAFASSSSSVTEPLAAVNVVPFNFPVTGVYTLVADGVFNNCSFVTPVKASKPITLGAGTALATSNFLTLGSNKLYLAQFRGVGPNKICTFAGQIGFWVEPASYGVNDFTAPFGGINSRPTSWEGINYGIIGDDGDLSVDNSNKTIVNETNNTVYNPATGETSNITDWSYNYEDRSYKVTTESGDTVTVTYGDESIVYKQGDTIYNIYYVAPGGSEDPVPTPTPCQHDWYGLVTLEPTCIYTGVKTFQCRKCSETYKEQIPATGHTWVIKETITTSYDEKGDLVQQGYTIYRCTVCGEEYKDTAGTGPPNGNEDSPSGGESGTSGTFSGIFGLLVDFLNFFFGTFKDFIGSGIKNFFTSLADGASDIFGLLNPFNWS